MSGNYITMIYFQSTYVLTVQINMSFLLCLIACSLFSCCSLQVVFLRHNLHVWPTAEHFGLLFEALSSLFSFGQDLLGLLYSLCSLPLSGSSAWFDKFRSDLLVQTIGLFLDHFGQIFCPIQKHGEHAVAV